MSRDAADSHAADNPSKVAATASAAAAAGADAGSKAAGTAAEKHRAGGGGAEGGGRSQRSVADFAKEVAALQEENKHLKQLLHNQVGGDSSNPGHPMQDTRSSRQLRTKPT